MPRPPARPSLVRHLSVRLLSASAAVLTMQRGAAADPAIDPFATPPLSVLYHGDLDGRFAEPNCTKVGAAAANDRAPTATSSDRPAPSDYPRLLATLAAAREEARAAGGLPPVVLLGGNLAAPALLGRGFLETAASSAAAVTAPGGGAVGGETGPRRLAALLARGGYDAVALGHHDLSLEPATLRAVVTALASRGMPVIATNLTCQPARETLCDAIRPHLMLRRGAISIGVVATISPSVLAGIAPAARDGLALGDPVAAVRQSVRQLRTQGATWVILMTQGPRDARGLEEIDVLQRQLGHTRSSDAPSREPPSRGPAVVAAVSGPDLILAGGLADVDEDGGRALRWLQRDQAPPVVGSGGGATSASNVLLPVAPSEGGTSVRVLSATSRRDAGDHGNGSSDAGSSAPERDGVAQALLEPELEAYCRRYAIPVSAVTLRQPLSRQDFLVYALEVMRRRAGAEIALLNRPLVKRTPFPLPAGGTITHAALHQALPYPATIGVVTLTGAAVETLIGPALANPKLAAAGLARPTGNPGGPLLVNGRPLDRARGYRVATIAFVAQGGDAILPPTALSWRPLRNQPDLRQSVTDSLAQASAPDDADVALGRPASERPLLLGLTDVGLDLADTRIANGPAYGDAQLTRANQRLVKGEATGLLQLRHPRHEADSRLNLKYGWTRSEPVAGPPASGETTDLITFTTVYNYRGLRGREVALPRPALPDPYLRVGLESEFTRPPPSPTQPRDFHHLELTNTAGALFTLTPALKVRGGAGVRKELLTASGDAGRWRPLLEAGAALSPVAVATVGALAVKVEGLLDYNFIDPSGMREHQLRGNGKLSLPLLPLLFITAGVDLFAVQRQRQGWGTSYDTTVGLRIHLDAAHQWL